MKLLVFILLSIICAPAYGRRIYGGLVLDPKNVPYQASMLITKDKKFYCGGSFLSKRIVITAAHCIKPNLPTDEYIFSGGGHYYEKDSAHFEVEKIIAHEKYDSKTANNDIAIFVLKKVSEFPKTISFVNLPKQNEKIKVGEKMFITGYGDSEFSSANKELRGAVVRIYDQKKCNENLSNLVTPQMICAGYESGGIDTCQGDSGGPMIRPEGVVLFGVTSWGIGCALKSKPGVYAKVSIYVDWIHKIANKYN